MIDSRGSIAFDYTALTPDWVAFDSVPAGNPFPAGAAWLQDALLGSVATSVAIVAVASIGFMMLNGRLPLRRGVTVVAGCFLLFGASSVATGLASLAARVSGAPRPVERDRVEPTPLTPPNAPTPPTAYDPYAGAAVPQR
jgi:type IV secretory pathway VirB2 component (pilin)